MSRGVTRRDAGVAARFVSVREALRLSQAELVDRLNAASRTLFGDDGPLFNQGRVSKLELGVQRASLDDIAIYASLDPRQRGKLWLAWNERAERVAARPTPALTPEPVGDFPLGEHPPNHTPAKGTGSAGRRRRA